MSMVGKMGIFNAYEDGTWGEKYAGKRCRVLAYDDESTEVGLIVIFDDGIKLAIQIEEFTELVN